MKFKFWSWVAKKSAQLFNYAQKKKAKINPASVVRVTYKPARSHTRRTTIRRTRTTSRSRR